MAFSGKRFASQRRTPIEQAIRPVMDTMEPRTMFAFSAVPTFESVGLYWSPTGGGSATQATVRYRVAGSGAWNNAQDLWFAPLENGRPAEYRGSVVGLTPGATYDVEVDMAGAAPPEVYQFTTWSENFPIAQTITVTDSSTPLEINNVNGSPTGYILYTGPATIDVANAAAYNIRVQNSSYVIIRGLTLTGATGDGILLGSGTGSNGSNVHDIVIENNDISNWGTVHPSAPAGTNWGYDDQSAVRSSSTNLERIIVQRNKMHHPRTDSNSWKELNPIINSEHPNGPQGITFENTTKGQFVIRYNEIYSDNDHRFNDGMGSDQNFGYGGFPVKDSDIYGNYITHTWDDALEVEGANMNVRVWGNYTDETYTGAAISGTSMGPIYVFRNVFQRSRTGPSHAYGGGAFKRGGSGSVASNGRIYLYNNTLFFTANPTFQTGIGNRTDANFATNTIGRNNILRVRDNAGDNSIFDKATDSSYDYDLYNGDIDTQNAADETNGLSGLPTYVSGAGINATTRFGVFQLTAASLGYDDGQAIANFTDGYDGTAPDIGAHEANKPAMQFGVTAYLATRWDGGATGDWATAANWTGDNVPDTAAEDAWIDSNPGQNSTVTYPVPNGITANIGGVTIDTGDALVLNKNTATGSASVILNGPLKNAGTLTTGGSSAGTAHGNSFTVTVLGESTFNTAGATIYTKSLGGYRRSLTTFNLPAASANAGTLYVQNISSQGGGKMKFGLVGAGASTFTNNGAIFVQGSGTDNGAGVGQGPWAMFGPATAGAALTLGGTGTLELDSYLNNRPDSYAILAGLAASTSLTNAASHTISGNGYVGVSMTAGASGNTATAYSFSSIANAGLIRAERSTNFASLLVGASGGSVTNESGGRMVAAGTAGTVLKIGSDSVAGAFVNNGLLEARSGSTFQIGSAVASTLNGTVRGAGTIAAPTLALTSSATLEPGNSSNTNGTGASTVGLMSVSGDLSLASGTALHFQLGATTTRGTTYDGVNVSGSLTLDGVLNVTASAGFGAGTYRLFNAAAGSLTNNGLSLGAMPAGYTGNIVVNSAAGTVDLVVSSSGGMMTIQNVSASNPAPPRYAAVSGWVLGSQADDALPGLDDTADDLLI